MPYFNEMGVIVDQFQGHHGMLEIYVHIISSGILFFLSLLSLVILYKALKGSKEEWPAMYHGFFYTGLIGFGEFLEHIYQWNPFMNTALHYTHYLAAPAAMLFFYFGINEYHYRCSHPDEELHTISNEVAMGAFAGVFTLAIIMGGLAETPWDTVLEGPFLIITIIPLLAITALFLKTASKIRKSMLAFYFPLFGISLSVLVIDIWIGRFGAVHKIASLYIISHGLQNVAQAATATIMVLFVFAVREGMREGVLYQCDCEPANKAPLKKKIEKDFRLDEQ